MASLEFAFRNCPQTDNREIIFVIESRPVWFLPWFKPVMSYFAVETNWFCARNAINYHDIALQWQLTASTVSFWLHTSSNFRDESTAMRHSRTTFNYWNIRTGEKWPIKRDVASIETLSRGKHPMKRSFEFCLFFFFLHKCISSSNKFVSFIFLLFRYRSYLFQLRFILISYFYYLISYLSIDCTDKLPVSCNGSPLLYYNTCSTKDLYK